MTKKSIFGSIFGNGKEVEKDEVKEKKSEELKPKNRPADDLYFQCLMQNGVENPKPPTDLKALKKTQGERKVDVKKDDEKKSGDKGYTPINTRSIGVNPPKYSGYVVPYVPPMRPKHKPVKKVKFVIFLIEDTVVMNEFAGMINKLFSSDKIAEKDNLCCIIRYGSSIKETRIVPKEKLTLKEYLTVDGISNEKAVFYDALKRVEEIVKEYNYKKIDTNLNEIIVDKFLVIGFGTGIDNFSKICLEEAIKTFSFVLSKGVKTKYFCTKENYMPNVSAIGFRSIGCMSNKY